MFNFLKELKSISRLESNIIRATKIHKVLRAMIKLTLIPLEEEVHFKNRAHALLQKWNEAVASEEQNKTQTQSFLEVV